MQNAAGPLQVPVVHCQPQHTALPRFEGGVYNGGDGGWAGVSKAAVGVKPTVTRNSRFRYPKAKAGRP